MAATTKDLIETEEFEKALAEGAEYKKEIITTYKKQNKDIYKQFCEVMLDANPEIKKLLETKRKNRSESDLAAIKDFKSSLRAMYYQTLDLICDENLEEGKKSKVEKIVDRVYPVIAMLSYIKNDKLQKEFAKHGIKLEYSSLQESFTGLDDDKTQIAVSGIFEEAKSIKDKVNSDNDFIENSIYAMKVPAGLQYDKQTNNIGLKPGDFKKLVDMKTKLLMANTDDAKDKANEKIEHAAAEKQFEAARAVLVRDKLTKME